MTPIALSIGELSRQSGLSTHTLRFYEAQGILQPASRNASGHRHYLPGDVQWLAFVLRLKRTGMPLAQIREYAALRAEGETTWAPRLAMLKLHREHLSRKIEELQSCAAALDEKMHTYQTMLSQPKAPRQQATP
ncbi:MerR family transcriptional regulator [uncultured Rhodoferax sp.]|uniref:MerR family transcriptional regulator n=1 Tax=uncultured Rhodoferax sp. TaxID=223188 RepID=UPI0025CB8A5D|nr:MerR family transcriptional regulator [uncultured Rhodoferax sp.]